MVDELEALTGRERELLADVDSRLFGYLKFQSTDEEEKKAAIQKAIKQFENILNDKQSKAPPVEESSNCLVQPGVYCKLGHWHLLLEEYSKALSAYQKFFKYQEDCWKDISFLYGLGLVYFHFRAYQWSIKAFQQVLYTDPGFSRANEIHIRLGLMFKYISDYETSLKHFKLALSDSNPATLSKFEIQFHVGHLHEVQSKYKQAKETYELLVDLPGIPPSTKANTLRQLGWMYHIAEELGKKQTRENQAIQLLQKSIEIDPASGQSWYLLGRCFSGVGKVHDAFVSYRRSIDKSEASADTWCSIGVLYQQQNQPMDALQAYICAVQLDGSHVAAWTDLGILYENCNQLKDALTCYVNASKNKACMNTNLNARVKFLEQQLNNIPPQQLQALPRTLPSIEEAWSLPIPAEVSQRQGTPQTVSQPAAQTGGEAQKVGPAPAGGWPRGEFSSGVNIASQQLQQLNQQHQMQQLQGAPPIVSEGPTPSKRRKGSAKSKKSSTPDPAPAQAPPFGLDAQQMQMLGFLQQNQANLNQQQHQLLQQLQHQYYAHQQHLAQQRQQQQQMQGPHNMGPPPPAYPGTTQGGHHHGNVQPSGVSNHGPHGFMSSGPIPLPPRAPSSGHQPMTSAAAAIPQQRNIPFVPSQTAAPPTSNQGLPAATTSISEMDLPKDLLSVQPTSISDQELTALLSQKDIATSLAEDLLAHFTQGKVEGHDPTPPSTSETDALKSLMKPDATNPNMASSANIGNKSSEKDILSELNMASAGSKTSSPKMSGDDCTIDMTGAQVIAACKGKGKHGVHSPSLLEGDAIPVPPPPPQPPLPKDKLNPPTPSVYLESKKDAFSQELLQYCLSQPVTVIRGLAGALKLDLGLFSTKSLVEANPDHQIEVRSQIKQDPDENVDQLGNKVWRCESSRSYTCVLKYAQYQASSFQESLREESERAKGIYKDSDSDSNCSTTHAKGRKKPKMLRFGTNVDLSDQTKWKVQLQELTKLPAFFKVVSACNMLSHVGYTVLGMNSVQLYMKVPGSRTPGHQENHNFCSVNINIGPGDCEWFATPEQYWGVIHHICEKNNINYLSGSWWPLLEDLYEENIPVYRFIQKPGDLVWVNTGTVHWVQSNGWCNNIAWNVGPMTGRSFEQAIKRYEWNKMQSYKSIVPMKHLSWSLARNVKITEPKLFKQVKHCLLKTLRHTQHIIDFAESLGKEIKWHGYKEGEAAHYCNNCELEVFNMLLVTEQDRKFVVHCLDCALKMSSKLDKFTILNQYKLDDLIETYDSFTLHVVNI